MKITVLRGTQQVERSVNCLARGDLSSTELVMGIDPRVDLWNALGLSCRPIQWRLCARYHRLLIGAPTGMVVRKNPFEWGSRSKTHGSVALYPAYWDLTKLGMSGGVLLQILPAGIFSAGETSLHRHNNTTERFYPLGGKSEIWTPRSGWQRIPWGMEISPGMRHKLRVRRCRGFAVTLIRMDGPHDILSMNDHHYDNV